MHHQHFFGGDRAHAFNDLSFVARLLMNRALVGQPVHAPQYARHIRIQQNLPLILVKLPPYEQQQILLFAVPADCLPQISRHAVGEIFVRVHDENPVPRRMGKRHVPRRRKIVLPRKREHTRAVLLRDLPRVVRRARIHYDDLVRRPAQALQRTRELRRFIPHDIAGRNPHPSRSPFAFP